MQTQNLRVYNLEFLRKTKSELLDKMLQLPFFTLGQKQKT